jgi:Fe2+ transport system protein FeoA
MKLSSIRKGARVQIQQLPEGDIRSQFIRIGLMEGAIVSCLERLPGGTLVLQQARQELAISNNIADCIFVSAL